MWKTAVTWDTYSTLSDEELEEKRCDIQARSKERRLIFSFWCMQPIQFRGLICSCNNRFCIFVKYSLIQNIFTLSVTMLLLNPHKLVPYSYILEVTLLSTFHLFNKRTIKIAIYTFWSSVWHAKKTGDCGKDSLTAGSLFNNLLLGFRVC